LRTERGVILFTENQDLSMDRNTHTTLIDYLKVRYIRILWQLVFLQKTQSKKICFHLILCCLFIATVTAQEREDSTSAVETSQPKQTATTSLEPPFLLPAVPEVRTIKSALIETNRGNLLVELYPEEAPWHVANFKYLADKGYYRGKVFHEFLKDSHIQTGAASSLKPNSGVAWVLPAEFSAHMPIKGALQMARFLGEGNPEAYSHGSQFHILIDDRLDLRGRYTIFGQVVQGLEVLQELRRGDVILNLTVYIRK